MLTSPPDGLRVLYAGTPSFAAAHLQSLLESHHDIIGVYTQPDRPAGRGKKLRISPVKALAQSAGMEIFQPESFRTPGAVRQLVELGADVMIVVAYGLILPQEVLSAPRFGCINVHASLLPKWRGAAPIQRAIEAGDTETGITIVQMNAGLDTGDMLKRVGCPIQNTDTAGDLESRLIETGTSAMLQVLNDVGADRLVPVPQDDSLATYAHKISQQDAVIDWTETAQQLDRQIRAFAPNPVCFSQLGGQRIKIHSVQVLEQHSAGIPGEIVQASAAGIDVQTAQGTVRILKLQMPGKKMLICGAVLRGNASLFAPGQRFALAEESS